MFCLAKILLLKDQQRATLLIFLFTLFVLSTAPAVTLAQSTPDYDTLVHQGNAQLQTGNNDLALGTAQSAIKLNADRWEAYALAGGSLMNLKRYEDAVDDFTKAIERAPEVKQQGLRDLRKQCLLAESGVSPSPAATPAPATAPASITQAEIVLWKSIENSTNPADFQSYLDQYPVGAFTVLAKRHLEEIQAQAEHAQWKLIEKSGNPEDFETYLKQYPNGTFVADARSRLVEVEKAKAQETALQRNLPTWTDPTTGLMWTGKDNGSRINWQQAVDYCKSTQWGGFGDWRLPSPKELVGIYKEGQKHKTLDDKITYRVKGEIELSGEAEEWSNTSNNKWHGYALYVNFNYGGSQLLWPADGNGHNGRAICVRLPAR